MSNPILPHSSIVLGPPPCDVWVEMPESGIMRPGRWISTVEPPKRRRKRRRRRPGDRIIVDKTGWYRVEVDEPMPGLMWGRAIYVVPPDNVELRR